MPSSASVRRHQMCSSELCLLRRLCCVQWLPADHFQYLGRGPGEISLVRIVKWPLGIDFLLSSTPTREQVELLCSMLSLFTSNTAHIFCLSWRSMSIARVQINGGPLPNVHLVECPLCRLLIENLPSFLDLVIRGSFTLLLYSFPFAISNFHLPPSSTQEPISESSNQSNHGSLVYSIHSWLGGGGISQCLLRTHLCDMPCEGGTC